MSAAVNVAAVLSVKQRRWIVHRKLEGGLSTGRIAASMRTSTSTVDRVWKAYCEGGWEAVEAKPRGRPALKLTIEQRVRLVGWRKKTGYGAQRMMQLMRAGTPWWPSDWPTISHNRINAVFREAGLLRDAKKRGPKPTYIRFEREHSNSLWQTDWHWLSTEEQWLIAYLDDHSRFITAAAIYDEATTANALELFEAAGARFGHPRQVLTDHGSQFTGTSPNAKRHQYPERLAELGTQHIMGQVRKPTTTGKIERWFYTYEDELQRFPTLEDKIWHYNFERIHLSLGYKVPALIYGQGLPLETGNRDDILTYLSSQIPSWATGGA